MSGRVFPVALAALLALPLVGCDEPASSDPRDGSVSRADAALPRVDAGADLLDAHTERLDARVPRLDASVPLDAGRVWPPDPPPREEIEVRTVAELLAALASATRGEVIRVAAGASLDLTGHVGISVPAQVTIAGDGGVGGAGGPLLFTTQQATSPLFEVVGEGARFTGLRLRGPDTEIGTGAYDDPLSQAILADHADNLQVDHCELWGWSYAAIHLDYSRRAYVHHNFIHHNRRTGLGYGVILNREADAIIERNELGDNRHDIAGTGFAGLGYVARYNRTAAARTSHAFDMHGEDETLDNGSPNAGDWMEIHHNTFLGTMDAIVIRGRPRIGAWVERNCFGQGSASQAIRQTRYTGNLHIGANTFGVASGTCHAVAAPGRAVRSDVNGDGLADLVTLSRQSAYTALGSGARTLTPLPPVFHHTMDSALFDGEGHLVVDVADVNGDMRSDLVTASSTGHVHVYPGTALGSFGRGVPSFEGSFPLATEVREGFEPLAVADVNGDGFGDLVAARAGSVYVWPGRADGTFGASVESFAGTFDSARFDGTGHFAIDVADVTGDERADLVTVVAEGTAYVYPGQASGAFGSGVASFSGTASPLVMLEGRGFEPVGVGDVNGDGMGDLVLAHTSGHVHVYPGAASGRFTSRAESFAGSLQTAVTGGEGHQIVGPLDVDGNGRADLVTVHTNGTVYVYSGTSAHTFELGVASLAGELVRAQPDGEGHELLSQKSVLRRRGCAASGCLGG